MFRLPDIFAPTIREAQERYNRVYEPVIAKVVDNVDPLRRARVKLVYPTLPGEDESYWATLSCLGAGKERGWFFLPEIDDEVLVMFEHGDIRRPVVIGALWNGVDVPPDQNGGNNERRVLVSRADSRIIFDDAEMKVTFRDGNGVATVTLLANSNEIIFETSGDVCLHVPGGELAAVADSIKISAGQKLKIHCDAPMKVGASAITIRGQTSLTLLGTPVNYNQGTSQMPGGTSAGCQEIADPVGSGSTSGGGGGGGGGAAAGSGDGGLGAATGAGSSPSSGPPPSTEEVASGHAGSSAPADTPAPEPEGQVPRSRHFAGLIKDGVDAAVRGVIKGTFGGSLPGIPMPGGGQVPSGELPGDGLPEGVGTPPINPGPGGGGTELDDVFRDVVTGAAKAAVGAGISAALSGDHVGRAAGRAAREAARRAAKRARAVSTHQQGAPPLGSGAGGGGTDGGGIDRGDIDVDPDDG